MIRILKIALLSVILMATIGEAKAQIPNDTNALRQKINTDIVPNASGGITATKLNHILNGIANLMKAYGVDSAYRIADTLFLTRRGGFTTIKVTLNTGGAPSESDPTVSAAAKTISGSDVTNWNSKQAALTTSSTISIVANVISANNTTALWNANQLQGRPLASTAPVINQVIGWDGTNWVPMTQSGAGGSDGNNYTTGATFNIATGILTQTRTGLANLITDFDGRYIDDIIRTGAITNYYKNGTIVFADTLKDLSVVNGTGTGDSLAVVVNPTTLKIKRVEITGSGVTPTITADKISYAITGGSGSVSEPAKQIVVGTDASVDSYIHFKWDQIKRQAQIFGNNTITANAALLITDTIPASVGSATTKQVFQIDPLNPDALSAPLSLTLSATKFTGVGVADNVFNWGWNIAPGGGLLVAGRAGLGWSLELTFVPSVGDTIWAELHEIYLEPNGTQHRLRSWTIRSNQAFDYYNIASKSYIKRPNSGGNVGQTYWNVQQSGPGMSFGGFLPDGVRGIVFEMDSTYGLSVSPVGGTFGFAGTFPGFSTTNFTITEDAAMRKVNGNIRLKTASGGSAGSGILYPETALNYNLGDPSFKFNELYTNRVGTNINPITSISSTEYYQTTLDSTSTPAGGFLFRESATGKIRVGKLPTGPGGGTTYFASQGLSLVSDTIRLGGTLHSPLTIAGGGHPFNFTGNGVFSIGGPLYSSGVGSFVNNIQINSPDLSRQAVIEYNNAGQMLISGTGAGAEYIATGFAAYNVPGTRFTSTAARFSGDYIFPQTDNAMDIGVSTNRWKTLYAMELGANAFPITNTYLTNLKISGGTPGSGKVLTSDASGNATWQNAPSGLPTQTGNAGKVLTTNGTTASWNNYFFPWDLAGRDSATTSNAVATTLATINIDNDTRGIIEVRLEGINATQGLTGIKRVRWKKIGSTLTLGTVEDEMAIERDGGLTTATFTISTSSNNIIIQVTGEASTTLDWKATYFINQKIAPL